jgi:hypothetical protein
VKNDHQTTMRVRILPGAEAVAQPAARDLEEA